ncbi:Palmitoyltransferase [Abortiporus biennis]
MAAPPSPQSLPTQSQRIATQLPFSPTSSSITSPKKAGPPIKPNGISNPHNRTGSVVSSRSRRGTTGAEVPYALPPMPIVQPRPAPSGSAVPGILPSASFFYPSRPNRATPPPLSPIPRESSPVSITSSDIHGLTSTKLAPLSKHYVPESDLSDSNAASTEDLNHGSKRSPRKSTGPSRLSLNVNSAPYGKSDSGVSPSGRMRDSFEKMFKRRSTDSRKGPSGIRTPTRNGSPITPIPITELDSPVSPVHGRMTFDVSDDDQIPMSAVSRYKSNSSPGHTSSISLPQFSFNPIPPDIKPPLSETPVLDEKTHKPVRKYQVHPSRNRFFLGGRVLTGGDSPVAFVASLIVVFGITAVYFSTTCVWWWHNESPAVAAVGAYMCLLTISSMFATAFRDPGILPRNLDPDPPAPAQNGSQESLRIPLPRDLKVRAGIVRVKYCPTCRTYRPPRSSHCKMCDNCVDNCDHHCQWVNNCVGRRNYTSFFTFLFSAVVTLVLVICTTAIHLWLLTTARYGLSFKHALDTSQGVGSAVAFCMSIIVVWPVSALLTYHLRLLLLNVTTIEQIRSQAHKSLDVGPPPPNPFSHGSWRKNLYYVLCRPGGYSWLDPRGIATQDKREINPGLLEDAWQGTIEEGRGRGKGQ